MQVIQWAIPSGGVGAAIAWIANRKARAAKSAKEVHDTYKAMYEDISKLLAETQEKYEQNTRTIEKLTSENALTRRAVNRLSRAVEAIQLCPHRATCPVSDELSLDTDNGKPEGDKPDGKKRLRHKRKKGIVDTDGEGGQREADDSGGQCVAAS